MCAPTSWVRASPSRVNSLSIVNVHKNVTLLERRFHDCAPVARAGWIKSTGPRESSSRESRRARFAGSRANPRAEPMATGIFCKSACHLAYRAGHVPRTRHARASPRARLSGRLELARAISSASLSRARGTRVVSSPRPRPTDRRCSFLRRPRARRSPRPERYVRASASTARLASADVFPPARSSRARALNRASSRTTLTPAAARTRCPSPPPPTPCARSVVARSPAVPSTAPSTTTATSSPRAR